MVDTSYIDEIKVFETRNKKSRIKKKIHPYFMNLVLAVSLVILRQTCLVKQGSKCFGAEPSLSSSFDRRNDHACQQSGETPIR